jgi:hypothetical protein
LKVSHIRFEDIDAAVSGMVEGELASKTIHNAVMLLRNMLAGRKGPTAFRRGLAFADRTLPEETWKLIKAAKDIGAVGDPITYLGAFCGLRRVEALGLRFVGIRWFDNEIRVQCSISKRRCQNGIHKRLRPIGNHVDAGCEINDVDNVIDRSRTCAGNDN